MTSAVLDDIGSLVLVAVLVSVATGGQITDPTDIAVIIIKVTAFWLNVAVPVTIAWWKRRFAATPDLPVAGS